MEEPYGRSRRNPAAERGLEQHPGRIQESLSHLSHISIFVIPPGLFAGSSTHRSPDREDQGPP
jgi:hypothetical protein